ncbi:septal ring lytic transglycosylase RlpA family protein [Aquincola sp. S2]|uniref:Endolytic peptidoglycan transglycosylase RlpA n=1 Tax=Pseudaquabacterium terrae TaxID=2732868 RepID=A0ABX2ELR6_9BURK|nr:septal ring lytic transglycosylase RlpA family protein [Aquabacterium terrae]NRF69548.1 septal ring lytic transglycosylase RlpA family protein [Aquabacterium terrae]
MPWQSVRSHGCVCGVAVLVALLAGCASGPAPKPGPGVSPPSAPGAARDDRDGPGPEPPPDLHRVPDAEPRLETPRSGGPNKPYEMLGQSYEPAKGDPALVERGLASWYGRKFHGRPTASGETYNMYAMSAAHKTMPIPSYARVRNPANGREVIVRINDRGPFHRGRIVDLSYTAALKLGVLNGIAPVELERITYEAIRTGSWRRAEADTALAAAVPPPNDTVPATAAVAPDIRPAQEMAAATPASTTALTPAARGFWLQLGAFRQREGALELQREVQRRVDWLAPLLAVFGERSLHRLQAGPYTSRDEANQVAERLREVLQLLPLIVERR